MTTFKNEEGKTAVLHSFHKKKSELIEGYDPYNYYIAFEIIDFGDKKEEFEGKGGQEWLLENGYYPQLPSKRKKQNLFARIINSGDSVRGREVIL